MPGVRGQGRVPTLDDARTRRNWNANATNYAARSLGTGLRLDTSKLMTLDINGLLSATPTLIDEFVINDVGIGLRKVTLGDIRALNAAFAVTTNNVALDINGTNIAIPWDQTAHIDKGGIWTHDGGGGTPSRIEVEEIGIYLVNVVVKFSTAVSDVNLNMQLRVNGTTLVGPVGSCGYISNAGGHAEASVSISAIVSLAADDYLEVISNREAAAGVTNMIAGDSEFNIIKWSEV